MTISNNEFYGNQYAMTIGNEFDTYAGNVDINLTVTDNNIHDNVDGGVIVTDEDKANGSSVTATFTDNIVDNNGDVGYFLYTVGDGDLTVLIDGDIISNHDDVGVYLEDYATGASGSSYDIDVHNSQITGNTNNGIQNDYAAVTLDAENNWWGSSTGPGVVGPGTGDKVSTYVDFSPWYNTSAMTTKTYYVTPGAGVVLAHSIQLAHDAASAGDTIVVADGTYTVATEPVASVGLINIYKQITIMAEDDGNSVMPVIDATGRDGVFKIHANALSGGQILVEGFDITGDKANTGIAITAMACDNGTPTDIIIRDNYIHGMIAGFDTWGTSFCSDPAIRKVDGIEITGNTFSDLGVDGVAQGVGIMLEDLSNWSTSGDQFAAVVEGNEFTDIYDGTSGNYGVGVVIPRADADNNEAANARIANNIFSSTVSVDVAITAGDVTDTEIVNNNFGDGSGMGVYVSGITNGPVNATQNWWGAADGPGTVGPGSGDTVSTNVDYSPWCATATCSAFAPVVLVAPDGIQTTWDNTFSWIGVTGATYYRVDVAKSDGTPVYSLWHSTAEVCSGTTCAISPASDSRPASRGLQVAHHGCRRLWIWTLDELRKLHPSSAEPCGSECANRQSNHLEQHLQLDRYRERDLLQG